MHVDSQTKAAFDTAAAYFPSPLQQFQFFNKYARFDYDKGRRETWVETVDRAVAFLRELSDNRLDEPDYAAIHHGILTMQVMPSMRLLAMAGPAARRNHIAIYNCSFIGIKAFDAFVEALTISMNGCGVGFSVESHYVNQLPIIPQKPKYLRRHIIEDSAEGWADALHRAFYGFLHNTYWSFDYSQIRPAGAKLRIKGGQASGPEPLKAMLAFVQATLMGAVGRKLTSLECHDLMCEIGNAAVSGGYRRTAMISLFDADDEAMLTAKEGAFPQRRWNANNSAVINGPIEYDAMEHVLRTMDATQRGEPGLFSRYAAEQTKPERRQLVGLSGTNPCGEILLNDMQFCNLSAVVARADDTVETLHEKVRLATIIGTIQSMATNFHGLRPEWTANAINERLLGVDITGQMDCPVVQSPRVKAQLRDHAVMVNQVYAERLGINPSAAITCVKPSGNSSTLLDCASGLHARHAPFYIRNVRVGAHDPVYHVLRDAGVPMVPENGQDAATALTWVAAFPVKAPDGAIVKRDLSALDQLKIWRDNKLYWTEHNPSVTITYRPHELDAIIAWCYEHQAILSGVSFLPESDAQYDNMPYVEITEADYLAASAAFPTIDWSRIAIYEQDDQTTVAQELACVSGLCEVVW